MSDWTKIALGALFGVLTGFVLQFWKSVRDERRVLCDEFCKFALEAADLASTYWKGGDDASDIAAARLVAFQRRLDGYRVLLTSSFTPEGNAAIGHAVANLFDSLTGGEFRAVGKPGDADRLQSAQVHASDLVIAIRRAFIDAVRPKHLFRWLTWEIPTAILFYIGFAVVLVWSTVRKHWRPSSRF